MYFIYIFIYILANKLDYGPINEVNTLRPGFTDRVSSITTFYKLMISLFKL